MDRETFERHIVELKDHLFRQIEAYFKGCDLVFDKTLFLDESSSDFDMLTREIMFHGAGCYPTDANFQQG